MSLGSIKLLFRYLVSAIIVTAGAQFILYRIISRVGIFIPKDAAMERVYYWLVASGSLAGHLTFWLTLFLNIMLAFLLWRKEDLRFRRLLGLLLLSLVVLIGVGAGGSTAIALLITVLAALVCLAAITGVVKVQAQWPEKVYILVLAITVVFSLLASLFNGLGQELGIPALVALTGVMFNSGQLLMFLSGFLLFLGCMTSKEDNPSNLIMVVTGASLAAAVFLFGFFLDPATTATLLQWGLGLNLVFPVLLYALSLWFFLVGLGRLVSSSELKRYRACGIVMLVLAGYHLPLNTDLMLMLGGLMILFYPDLLLEGSLQKLFGN